MKVILTSNDSSLRSTLQSEDFQVVNNACDSYCCPTDYTEISVMPTIGACMYFYNNYYYPVVVRVVNIIYGKVPTIFCEYAKLHDVEPYIYTVEDKISKEFVEEVKDFYTKNLKILALKLLEDVTEYGSDVCKINNYAINIINGMDLEKRSVLDFHNLLYTVCKVLSVIDKESFGEWHRPTILDFDLY